MRDVATLARVGVMTVSRVVNGRSGVSAERAARVAEVLVKPGTQVEAGDLLLRFGS